MKKTLVRAAVVYTAFMLISGLMIVYMVGVGSTEPQAVTLIADLSKSEFPPPQTIENGNANQQRGVAKEEVYVENHQQQIDYKNSPSHGTIHNTPGPAITSVDGYPSSFRRFSSLILQTQADQDRVHRWSQYSAEDWERLVAGYEYFDNHFRHDAPPGYNQFWRGPDGSILRDANGEYIVAIKHPDAGLISWGEDELARRNKRSATSLTTATSQQGNVNAAFKTTVNTSPAVNRKEFLVSEIEKLKRAIASDERLLNEQGWGESLAPVVGGILSLVVQNSTNEYDQKLAPYASPVLDIGGESLGREFGKAKGNTEWRLRENRELLKKYETELKSLENEGVVFWND